MDAPGASALPAHLPEGVPAEQVVAGWGEASSIRWSRAAGPVRGRGRADLVQEFTQHYPFQIIYRQLACRRRTSKVFHKLAIAQTVVSYDVAHGTEASRKLGVYFEALARRAAARIRATTW